MVVAALDHPNVLPLFEAEEAEGVLYLASRWIAGCDVGKLVAQKGPVAVEEAVRIVTEVASALHAAHRAGVVHRGVKPSNVLVADNGHVYLSDFGITPPASDRTGLTGMKHLPPQWPLTGTLNYVSPERIRGERVDGRADVYGLGGVLAFALSRRVPYHREGHPASHASSPPTHRRRAVRAATCPISSTPSSGARWHGVPSTVTGLPRLCRPPSPPSIRGASPLRRRRRRALQPQPRGHTRPRPQPRSRRDMHRHRQRHRPSPSAAGVHRTPTGARAPGVRTDRPRSARPHPPPGPRGPHGTPGEDSARCAPDRRGAGDGLEVPEAERGSP